MLHVVAHEYSLVHSNAMSHGFLRVSPLMFFRSTRPDPNIEHAHKLRYGSRQELMHFFLISNGQGLYIVTDLFPFHLQARKVRQL